MNAFSSCDSLRFSHAFPAVKIRGWCRMSVSKISYWRLFFNNSCVMSMKFALTDSFGVQDAIIHGNDNNNIPLNNLFIITINLKTVIKCRYKQHCKDRKFFLGNNSWGVNISFYVENTPFLCFFRVQFPLFLINALLFWVLFVVSYLLYKIMHYICFR